MRVERIHDLASWALGADAQALDEKIASGETTRQPLAQNIPVYVQYWTAIGNSDGIAAFRDDVYGRDAPLIRALGIAGSSTGAELAEL